MATFELVTENDLIDEILDPYRDDLGTVHPGIRNHCLRMLNYCRYMVPAEPFRDERIAVMAAFHDLPVLLDGDCEYVSRGADLAEQFLEKMGHPEWAPEIRAMCENHHKVTRYRGPHTAMVEAARRADWMDVSFSILRFDVPRPVVREVAAAFPVKALYPGPAYRIIGRYAIRHPLRPMPMMRW